MSADEPRVSSRIAAAVARGSDEPPQAAPWSAEHETELKRYEQKIASYWKREAQRLLERNRELSAALSEKEGRIKWMDRNTSQYYDEVKILRLKLGRWDERNWADLCVSALNGEHGNPLSMDRTSEITDSKAFRLELAAIHERRDEACRDYLQTHAFRVQKQLLAKVSHRLSGRKMGWQNSLFKFDHSKRDPETGESLREREVMCENSKVRAPQIFEPKVMRAAQAAELECGTCDEDGNDIGVNSEHEDRRGAEVRDVRAAMWRVVDRAKAGVCGGFATAGTEADPHWIIATMDGAGVSRTESAVRVALFPGSVELMNQSKAGICDVVRYKAGSAAESYPTLDARLSGVRPQLAKIWRDGFITRRRPARAATAEADGVEESEEKIYVKILLTADKSGMCHLLGRKSNNYDCFGLQCDCSDKNNEMHDLTKPPLTHFDNITFAKRVGRAHTALWDALDETEPDNWTVHCDCCDRVRAAPTPTPQAQPQPATARRHSRGRRSRPSVTRTMRARPSSR